MPVTAGSGIRTAAGAALADLARPVPAASLILFGAWEGSPPAGAPSWGGQPAALLRSLSYNGNARCDIWWLTEAQVAAGVGSSFAFPAETDFQQVGALFVFGLDQSTPTTNEADVLVSSFPHAGTSLVIPAGGMGFVVGGRANFGNDAHEAPFTDVGTTSTGGDVTMLGAYLESASGTTATNAGQMVADAFQPGGYIKLAFVEAAGGAPQEIAVSDDTSSGESASLAQASRFSVDDTTTTAEVATVQQTQVVAVGDITASSESATLAQIQTLAVSDDTASGESVSLSQVQRFAVADATTSGEQAEIRQAQAVAVEDATASGESVTPAQVQRLSVADATSSAESVDLRQRQIVDVADQTASAESVTLTQPAEGVAVADNTATGESVTVSQTQRLAATNTTSSAESVELRQRQAIGVADGSIASESITLAQTTRLAVADDTASGESVTLRQSSATVGVDSATTSGESVTLRQAQAVVVEDDTRSAESASVRQSQPIAVADATNSGEFVDVRQDVRTTLSVSDGSTSSESVVIRSTRTLVSVTDGSITAEVVTLRQPPVRPTFPADWARLMQPAIYECVVAETGWRVIWGGMHGPDAVAEGPRPAKPFVMIELADPPQPQGEVSREVIERGSSALDAYARAPGEGILRLSFVQDVRDVRPVEDFRIGACSSPMRQKLRDAGVVFGAIDLVDQSVIISGRREHVLTLQVPFRVELQDIETGIDWFESMAPSVLSLG